MAEATTAEETLTTEAVTTTVNQKGEPEQIAGSPFLSETPKVRAFLWGFLMLFSSRLGSLVRQRRRGW